MYMHVSMNMFVLRLFVYGHLCLFCLRECTIGVSET